MHKEEGVIAIPENGKCIPVHYWLKVGNVPSKYGINGGRILELTMSIGDKIVANFDHRGWDIEPDLDNYAIAAAYAILLYEENERRCEEIKTI